MLENIPAPFVGEPSQESARALAETRDQSHMPDVLHIEATGLGGRDLGYPERWDLSLRSDPEGQQVYGPSLANVEIIAVEDDGGSGKRTKHVSALGLTKATNEFLVLHYFAIDSAEAWDEILCVLLPKVRFPDAVVRRSVALKLFNDCHIAPSHRRFPHQLWLDSMCLISDLLVGCGVGRYLGGGLGPAFEQQVALRGFSAGSFSGLCLLHILWPMPGVVTRGILGAIACPPDLLTMSPALRRRMTLCTWYTIRVMNCATGDQVGRSSNTREQRDAVPASPTS